MSLSKQLYLIIAFIFFIIFSGNFLISVNNMKEYLQIEASTKAQDTAISLGMSLKPLISDKQDPEIESIIRAISNSGFYKEIRLEDADFIIKSSELINASTDLDEGNWQITKISVDPKYGYVEKVESDEVLNEQLLKLEDEADESDDIQEDMSNIVKYRYVPSKLYKNGGNITFDFTAVKDGKKVDTFANLTINKILLKETRDVKFDYVPKWFINLIPIKLSEKHSEISNGWNTSAIIYVSANPGEAYAKLYDQAKNSIIYAVIAFIISIILLFVFVQFILRPLKRIEKLAKDIAKGQFNVIEPLPWTIEIKNVSIAMNDMSRKIEAMINKLTNNLANLSKKLSEDELTGLSLKQTLETDIKQMFVKKESGYVFDIKIDNLSRYVKTHTDDEIDDYITKFASILKNIEVNEDSTSKAYRIFGSEFLLVVKNCDYDCARVIALKLKKEFNLLSEELNLKEIAHIGATPFNELGTLNEMRQAANEAYEKAKLIGPNEFFIGDKNDFSRDANDWRDLITEIIDNNNFEIDFINNTFVLEDEKQNIIMQEAFTKAKDKENNPIPIGSFISIAEKYEKIVDFDKAVVMKIINFIEINSIKHNICINLSIDSIANSNFINWLEKEINKNKDIASQLVFSFSAYSVAKDMNLFKDFCEFIHNCGSKIIIKRFESKFIPTENLKEFNLDYIRLARDYTIEMNKDHSKVEFVESINELGNLLNIKVCAEAVKEAKDLEVVKKLKLFAISK